MNKTQITKSNIEAFLANISYAHAKALRDEVNAAWSNAGKELNDFIDAQGPRGSMGLTPDRVKTMPEYVALKRKCDQARDMAQAFNAVFTKRFKREYAKDRAAERDAKWAALCA